MNVFHCKTLQEVSAARANITQTVETVGFTAIRGLFDRVLIRTLKNQVYRRLNATTHKASAGVTPAEESICQSGQLAGKASHNQVLHALC